MNKIISLCLLTMMLFASQVFSQEDSGVPEEISKIDDTEKAGWVPALVAGATFSIGSSSNVPGATDGTSYLLGYLIDGKLDYLSNNLSHKWANHLNLELGFTRTPVVDVFVKSIDTVDYKTGYFYHFKKFKKMGPYVTGRLTTSMLKTAHVKAEASNVIRLEVGEEQLFDAGGNLVDGSGTIIDDTHASVENYLSGEKIDLTGAFAPLTLREAVGLFYDPVQKESVNISTRLGFASWESFARKGYVVEDNADTEDFIELRRLQDSIQAGFEIGIIANGKKGSMFVYEASALFMQPVAHNAKTEDKGFELLNKEFEAKLGLKLLAFLSLNYSFKAYEQPLIVEGWQIQNSLLLSIGINLPKPKPEPQEEPVVCPVVEDVATEETANSEEVAIPEEATAPEEVATPEETTAPEETATPEETTTPKETATSEQTELSD